MIRKFIARLLRPKHISIREVTLTVDGDSYEFIWVLDNRSGEAQFKTSEGMALANIEHGKATAMPDDEGGIYFPPRWIIKYWRRDGRHPDPWLGIRESYIDKHLKYGDGNSTKPTLEEATDTVEKAVLGMLKEGWQSKDELRNIKAEIDNFSKYGSKRNA